LKVIFGFTWFYFDANVTSVMVAKCQLSTPLFTVSAGFVYVTKLC